jgi:hypothetical protein
MFTCRQIYQELELHRLYTENTFIFTHIHAVDYFLDHLSGLSPSPSHFISCITFQYRFRPGHPGPASRGWADTVECDFLLGLGIGRLRPTDCYYLPFPTHLKRINLDITMIQENLWSLDYQNKEVAVLYRPFLWFDDQTRSGGARKGVEFYLQMLTWDRRVMEIQLVRKRARSSCPVPELEMPPDVAVEYCSRCGDIHDPMPDPAFNPVIEDPPFSPRDIIEQNYASSRRRLHQSWTA